LQQDSKPDAIRKFDREITTLQIELEWLRKEIKYGKRRKLKSKISNERKKSWSVLDSNSSKFKREGNFARAGELRYSMIPSLEAKLPQEGSEVRDA
jgi:ATP-dependent Clp protease ATP-binding subunit ClpB